MLVKFLSLPGLRVLCSWEAWPCLSSAGTLLRQQPILWLLEQGRTSLGLGVRPGAEASNLLSSPEQEPLGGVAVSLLPAAFQGGRCPEVFTGMSCRG